MFRDRVLVDRGNLKGERGNLYWGRIASSFFVSCVQVDRGNLYWGRIASSFFVSCVV